MNKRINDLMDYIRHKFPIRDRKTKKEFTDLNISGMLKLKSDLNDSYIMDLKEFIENIKSCLIEDRSSELYNNFIELSRDSYAIRLLKIFFFLINFERFQGGTLSFEFAKFNKKTILIDSEALKAFIAYLNSGVLNSINLIKRKCHRLSAKKEDLNKLVFKPFESKIREIYYELSIETKDVVKFLLVSGIRSNYTRKRKTLITSTVTRKPLVITDEDNPKDLSNLTVQQVMDRICPPKNDVAASTTNINENEESTTVETDNEDNNDSQLIQINIGTQRFDFQINKDNWGKNPIIIKI